MARPALPQTEVLVTADCWQAEPGAEAVIHRAIEAAAEIADADTGDAEAMETLEREILAEIGIPDPYAGSGNG